MCSTAISTVSWRPPCRSAFPARKSRWRTSIKSGGLLSLRPEWRDVLRLALQAAFAGSLALIAVRLAGTGEAFLAVISAVLVLQRNRAATLESAGSRIVGTVIGTIVGIAALALADGGFIPWPLAAAMLIMGGLAAWKPGLRYGIVAAAGLAVGSEQGFLETAQNRSFAIFIGAGVGIAAGSLVWPETARARARRQIGEALSLCRNLLERTLDETLHNEERDVSDLHSRFARTLAIARDTAGSIGLGRKAAGQAHRDAVHGTERLWHALIILGRVAENLAEEPLHVGEEAADQLQSIRSATSEALACLARFERVPEKDLDALTGACREAWQAADTEQRDEERLQSAALIFGLGEVARNICEIDRAICAIRAAR